MAEELFILSVDHGRNTVELESSTTTVALMVRMSMWGEPMWGDVNLGGALTTTYIRGSRFIASDDVSLNIVRL